MTVTCRDSGDRGPGRRSRTRAAGGRARGVRGHGDQGEPLPGVHRIVARMPFDLPVHPFGVGHLTRRITSARPDVVHVHAGAVSPFAWMGVRAAFRAGVPCVVTVHSMWDPVTRWVYRLLRLAYGWQRWRLVATTVSNAAAVPIRAVAGPLVPVRVVSNGLDLSGWAPPPARRRAAPTGGPRCTSWPWAGWPRASSPYAC
ncbi:glycosyltransferase family 4 protein [Nonomuraea antimicrobica]